MKRQEPPPDVYVQLGEYEKRENRRIRSMNKTARVEIINCCLFLFIIGPWALLTPTTSFLFYICLLLLTLLAPAEERVVYQRQLIKVVLSYLLLFCVDIFAATGHSSWTIAEMCEFVHADFALSRLITINCTGVLEVSTIQ